MVFLVVVLLIGLGGPLEAQSPAGDPIFVGAGDIAACSLPGDEQTAALIEPMLKDARVTVFTAGDNAYESGTPGEFEKCYGPTWGRFKKRTYPVPGNHEYVMPYAQPYYDYFGKNAGPARLGYYSFDLGKW